MECEWASRTCAGPVVRVVDPYQQELFDETVAIEVCQHHLDERRSDI